MSTFYLFDFKKSKDLEIGHALTLTLTLTLHPNPNPYSNPILLTSITYMYYCRDSQGFQEVQGSGDRPCPNTNPYPNPSP